MKKNCFATFALALSALVLPLVSPAVGTKGDIYSITPYDVNDVGRVFKAGETIKFRVRLLASDWNTAKPSKWVKTYVGGGTTSSEIIADAMFPPRLGLVISGQLRKADIVNEEFVVSSTDDAAYVFTDLICAYTVQSGDLALPALLALAGSTEDKPIAVGDVAATTDHYFVDNANLWQYVNATSGDACQFFYMDTTEANPAWDAWRSKTKPAVDKQLVDKDLTKANFLVKGVDFDRDPTHEEKAQDGTAHWRVVRQGKESVKGTPAPIVTSGTPEKSVTLYVWSENEDVVRMAGDAVEVDFPTNRAGTLTVKRWVTKITTEQGRTDYALAFKGVKQGESATIVLSPIMGYRFDSTGRPIDSAYLTETVYCDEPEKPNAQISFSETSVTKYLTVDTSMETVDTLKNSAIPVYITLSEPSPDPIDVWLVISNKTNVACDPITNQNIAVLQTDYFVETREAYTNFTLDAYQTTAKVYVYPIGGTDDTQDKGIDIGLKLDANAAAHYKEKVDPLNLKIRKTHTPVIVSPVAEDDFGQRSTGIDGFPVNIQVSDCYRDLQARPFEVSVTYSDMSSMTTNVFFKAGLDTQIQLKGYGVNATYANITVKDPVGNVSKPVKILFAVEPQKTVSATLYDSTSVDSRHDGESFEEGSTAYVQFSLSQELPYGADRWAFLVPQNEASSNLIECAAFTKGVKIPGGVTNSTLVACSLTMLDGSEATRQGELLYRIMLRTADTLTEGEEDTTYIDAKGLQFEVVNVRPLTEGVYVNGAIDPAPQGELWPTPVPSGETVKVPFTVLATDVSINDQTNLVSVWCVTEGRAPRQKNIFYAVPFTNSIETATLEHSFTIPLVEQTVRVITLDKDLLKEILPEATPQTLTAEQVEKSWASFAKRVAPYEFRVTVEDAPHVVVELVNFNDDASIDEKGNGGTAKIRVSLSEPATTDVNIELTLKPLSADDPGYLTFKNAAPTDAGYNSDGVTTLTVRIPKNSLEPSSKDPLYNKGTGYAFMYDLINGTAGSENDGWDVTAKVVTPAWENYYELSEGNYFIVRNLTPTVKPAQPAEGDPITTNKTVSIGKAFDITWTPGDVLADLKAEWPGTENKGLKCEWYINDAYQAGKTTYVTCGADNKVYQQTTSITLNEEGLSVVKLVITDLDGEDYRGVTERTWYYYIAPTKKLAVTPVGPAGNSKAKYAAKAAGIGAGRVWTNGGSPVVAAFSQTWSYNVSTYEGEVHAFGYPSAAAAYPDNGKLGPGERDVAISPDGESAETGKAASQYYNYPGVYDNYFYRWVYVVPSESGGAATVEFGDVRPTTKADADTIEPVTLDAYEPEKESYATRRLEAVFSRELYTGDNLGDINADSIPDVYVLFYPGFGIANEEGVVTGDDLANLAKFNADGDYLPNTMDAPYAAFIPQLSNTWVTAGRAFTARLEVRGWGEGLNDAPALAGIKNAKPDRVYEDPTVNTNSTLAYVEYVSFTNWCDRTKAGDPTDKSLWAKWSPERPTDPTLYDTDDDGMPDGYEYYIWYKAHVGELVVTKQEKQEKDRKVTVSVTNLVRYTGRKYNIVDPVHPIEITADEIEKIYDPITPNDQLAEIDTDLDGLPDLVEFEIGTNPFDYDTDHDLLPDGWEVVFSKTDPLNANNDADKNDDGDTMAYVSMPFWRYSVEGSNEVAGVWMTVTNYVYSYGRIATEGVDAEVPHSIFTAFPYKPGELDENGKQKPDAFALGAMRVNRDAENNLAQIAALGIIPDSGEKVSLAVMHDQLLKYSLKPFDPRTGWGLGNNRPDTKAYQNYDEFMLLAFYLNTDEATLDDRSLDIASDPHFGGEKLIDMWARTTTDPHNADTNGDGVPDGWQLYVSWNHSVCEKDDPIIKQERKFLKQVGPFGGGSPIYDVGSGNKIVDSDNDGLNLTAEFCGTESCAFYAKCETIKNIQPEWRNKKWPTDPWNEDTDGDGLKDGEERVWLYGTSGMDGGGLNPLSWDTDLDGLPDPWELEFCGTYSDGSSSVATSQVTATNAVATADGGTSNVVETATATNVVVVAGKFNNDGMNPTGSDASADYDGDGLLNWQEYMVGTMRCWRYDDSVTPWAPSDGLGNGWGEAYKPLLVGEMEELFNGFSYVDLFRYFEGRWTVSKDADMIEAPESDYVYNRGFRTGHIDPGAYFSCCKNPWDPAFGGLYYFKDGVDHDLKDDWIQPWKEMKDYTTFNRYQAKTYLHVSPDAFLVAVQNAPIYPKKYISCNPKESDTDFDGMDDYYELFHGLNPLLGAAGSDADKAPCDIIYIAYGAGDMLNATANYYLYWDNESGSWVMNLPMRNDGREGGQALRLKDVAGGVSMDPTKYLDFYQFPWLAGLPTADPDGDNIRNQQESILLKAQAAPTYQHTDPTPLWMTDTSFDYSLTKRFYQALSSGDIPLLSYIPVGYDPGNGSWDPEVYGKDAKDETPTKTGWFVHDKKLYMIDDIPWLKYIPALQAIQVNYNINRFEAPANIYSYEENEGYDSDHDYLSDFEESQGRTKPVSDPQQHDDPIRHQAMYFDGVDARLQAPLEIDFPLPSLEASSESRQDFLYFTVEAWAKVDQSNIDDGALHTVIERAVLTGESGPADEKFLRKNFLIGVKGGRWYGKFDSTGTDAGKSIEILDAPAATTNWTHLAFTYGPANGSDLDETQPMALRLYVHDTAGKLVGKGELEGLRLQPEHGESAIQIDPQTKVGMSTTTPWMGKAGITIVVGASVATESGIDMTNLLSGPDAYENYFKGYIDEVRVWDGARKDTEIADTVMTRYTSALAQENRDKVFEAWKEGGLRTPLSPTALPAELRYHWAFDHLPSAVDTTNLLKVPAGFSTSENVLDSKALWVRPEGYVCPWWASVATVSSVFSDYAWVPWINNTVSHLPCLDGSTLDSIYWSETFAGDQSVTNFASSTFAFPRSAEVWSYLTMSTPAPTWWNRIDADMKEQCRFNLRNRVTVGADLLPLGGAYPKRISSLEGGMWDDPSASDAWAETGADTDDNGLPDWWEKYAMKNYSPVLGRGEPFDIMTTVDYHGKAVSAKDAYLFDLAIGMLPDGKIHPEYADTRDTDKDGVYDFFAEAYNLMDGHAGEDDDGDGLSNYAEYLITEVFKYADCDPKKYATDGRTCDYFKKVGDLYLGEIFTDHDMMDDVWEAKYDVDYVNRGIFDPFADGDGDGWSNYAEFRAGTDPTTEDALSIDGYVCPEYPVPAIAANVIYHGATVIRKPFVFKVWNETTDYAMTKAPDAMWTIGGSEEGAANGANGDNATSGLLTREKFIGRKPTGERTFYLAGGNVSEGSVKLLFLDKGFGIVTYDPVTQYVIPVDVGEPDDAQWYYFIIDKGGKLVRAGGSLYAAMGEEEVVVGTVDYKTGKVTIDFSHEELCGDMLGDPSTIETSGDQGGNAERPENTYDYLNLDESYVRVEWKASASKALGPGLYYLSDPDEVNDETPTFGHVREGKNTFVCFEDADGNGEYSPGELFGVVRGVDVGWSGASFDIELTPTYPIFGRCDLTGNNDRTVWYGVDSGNVATDVNDEADGGTTGSTGGETLSNDGKKMHVRVDRYAINGMKIGLDAEDELLIQYNRVLFDNWMTVGARTYLHEGDFMNAKAGEFDLDWAHFDEIADDAAVLLKFGGEVMSVSYRVVVDNSDFVHPVASNKMLSVAFTRTFDTSTSRTKATDLTLDPAGIVYGARPTFKWSMKMAGGKVNNSYTAFRLRILDANGARVYESPMTFVPPMDDKGFYVWKAPFSVGDQTPQGKVLGRAGDFKWCVSMYNAKFKTDAYCTPVAFSTAVGQQQLTDDHGYGAVKVAVKYAGPANVLSKAADVSTTNGMVRVQAFSRPDFTGVPESQTFATNVAAITNTTDLTANVTLYGLKAGTYYIRAYVDSDGDFEKDDWESWGYAKTSVEVASGVVPATATVWIEDADTDGDWLPDAYEFAKNGNLTTENAMVDPNGKIILKTATCVAAKNGYASISTSLPGASLTLFENLDAAKLLLGLGNDTTLSTIDAIREAIAKRISPGSVKITQLSMNAPRKTVSMSVAANVTEPENSLLSAVYTVPDATTVTIEVYRAEDLGDDWTLVDTKQVRVNAALDATFEIPVNVNSTTGYYKVVVVE